MIKTDTTLWPVVLTVAGGDPSVEEHVAFLEEWNQWLAREEEFVFLRIFLDPAAMVHPPGASKHAKQWLLRNALRLRRQVMGMVSVVPASEYERSRKINVQKLFGVPGAVYIGSDEALSWVGEALLKPRAIPWDVGAVASRIDALRVAAMNP